MMDMKNIEQGCVKMIQLNKKDFDEEEFLEEIHG